MKTIFKEAAGAVLDSIRLARLLCFSLFLRAQSALAQSATGDFAATWCTKAGLIREVLKNDDLTTTNSSNFSTGFHEQLARARQ